MPGAPVLTDIQAQFNVDDAQALKGRIDQLLRPEEIPPFTAREIAEGIRTRALSALYTDTKVDLVMTSLRAVPELFRKADFLAQDRIIIALDAVLYDCAVHLHHTGHSELALEILEIGQQMISLRKPGPNPEVDGYSVPTILYRDDLDPVLPAPPAEGQNGSSALREGLPPVTPSDFEVGDMTIEQ